MSKFKDIISNLIATCFFVGKIKYAPGTFGSLLAFPINYFVASFVVKSRFLLPIEGFSYTERELATLVTCLLFSSLLVFFVGWIASNHYIKRTGREDPKEIVIDEVAGQMLTSALTFFSVAFLHVSDLGMKLDSQFIDVFCYFLLPFALFRLCDIIKPWPIGWMDRNIKGGLGVMLDDMAAGFMAVVLHHSIIFLFV